MKLNEFLAQHAVFTVDELDRFLSERGGSGKPNTRKSLLTYYRKQGRIIAVRRGLYATVPFGADSESSPVADSVRNSEPVSWEQTAVASSSAPPPIMKAPEAKETEAVRMPEPTTIPEPTQMPSDQDMSGFDKAVYYIGEHSSVHLAAVVDEEGLLLGNFTRHDVDAEAWAPMALLFLQGGKDVLSRADLDGVERLELQLKEKRIVVGRSKGCNLIVVSERHDDDLLNIRINQGLEMINRLVAERYADKLNSNAERIHVSSAQ